MAKRVYSNTVKKWVITSGVSATTIIGLIFLYLSFIGVITITGYSKDVICAGTIEDSCRAFINFTANNDTFLYPINYDPYDRDITIDFNPGVKSWKIERSWGKGWREINMTTNCKGTWCGAPDNTGRTKYSIAFREGRDYRIRITVFKINPNDNVKWSAFGVDPTFFGLNNESLKKEYNSTDREISFNSRIDQSNQIKIKLGTELNHSTFSGPDRKVAITNIENNYGNYPFDLILGPVEFSYADTGTIFNRDYHYEYLKSTGFKTINDYGPEICVEELLISNNSKKVDCIRFITGTHQEEQFEWAYLNLSEDMSKGNLTVALVTDVFLNDNVEWVPTYFGIRSEEFATWTDGLNAGMSSVYDFESKSGPSGLIDIINGSNGTIGNSPVNITGIYGSGVGFNFSDTDYFNITNSIMQSTGPNGTLSFWFKSNDTAGNHKLMGKYSEVGSFWCMVDTGKLICAINDPAQQDLISNNSVLLANNTWHNGIITYGNLSARLWLNGVLVAYDATTQKLNFSYFPIGVRVTSGSVVEAGDSEQDEFYIWNRVITEAEIAIVSAGDSFYTTEISPIINVFSPTNKTYSISTIYFNATNSTGIDNWTLNYNGTNITDFAINTTLDVEDGSFQLLLYANSTTEKIGLNDTIYFTVDANPINIFSPTNTTYSISTIYFNATNSTPIDNWTLNYNGTNITDFIINTTLEVEDGFHQVLLYANISTGQIVLNDTIYFTVDTAPIINVFSPINTTYPIQTIYFNATNTTHVDKWIVNYNGTNVTLSDINTTLEVEVGGFQLLLYANNSDTGAFGLNDTIYFTVNLINLSFEGLYRNISAELGSITINATTSLGTVCVDIDHPRFGINYSCGSLNTSFEFNPNFIRKSFTNDSIFDVLNFSKGVERINLTIDSHQYDEADNLSINITGTNNPFDVTIYYANKTPDVSNTTQHVLLIDRWYDGILNGPVIYLNSFSDGNTTKNLTYLTKGEKIVFFVIDDIISLTNTDYTFFINVSGFPFGIDFKDGNSSAGTEGFDNFSLIDTVLTTAQLDISGTIMAKNTSEAVYSYDDFEDGSLNDSLWITSAGLCDAEDETCTVTESEGNMILTSRPDDGNAEINSTTNSTSNFMNRFQSDIINFSLEVPGRSISSGSFVKYNVTFGTGLAWNLTCQRTNPGDTSSAKADLNISLLKINKTHWKSILWGTDQCISDLITTDRTFSGTEIIFPVSSSDLMFRILSNRGTGQGAESIMNVNYVNRTLATRENSSIISNSIYDTSLNIVSATLNLFGPDCCTSATGEAFLTWLSADDGLNWESVTLGVSHNFNNPGKNLKWRFDFNITDPDNWNSTLVISQVNVTIPTGDPQNVSFDFGDDGTNDVSLVGAFNTTNGTVTINLSGINVSSAFVDLNLLEKTSTINYEHTYLIPLSISSDSIGTITIDNINLTYNPNPVALNVTNLTNVLSYSTGSTSFSIPIAASNSSTENFSLVTVDDLKYEYAGGNFSVNITAHDLNNLINITREIFFYYSRWDFEFGLASFPYLYFSPVTSTSKNVTPYGQTSDRPMFNFTNLGYGGKNANDFIYLNDSLACVDLYASTNNIKPLASLWDNLTAYYPFDIDARDLSGNENNGTVTGATFNSTGGQLGGAYEFDGVDDYINASNSSSLQLDNLTIYSWIKINAPDDDDGYHNIVSKESGTTTNREYNFYVNGDGLGKWSLHFSATNSSQLKAFGADGNEVMNRDEWYQVTITRSTDNSGQILFYINGVLNSSHTGLAFGDYFKSSGNLKIGKADNLFNGTIDDVRIYNRSLGTAEISTLYNRSFNKYFDVKLQSDWQAISWDNSYLNTFNVSLWADYSCSFSNFTLFEPFIFIRQCAEGVDFCSEDLT